MLSTIVVELFSALLLTSFDRSIANAITKPYYCKDDGKCYAGVVGLYLTWNKAEEYCEINVTSSARLASVHNAFDNAIIAGMLKAFSTNPWIGAYRVGNQPFTWSDGTSFENQYTHWAPGQPSGFCAQVCSRAASAGDGCQQGMWTTADCSNQAEFICEYGNWKEPTTTRPSVPSCPDQWTYFPDTKACYRTFLNAMTWGDAEETCRMNGADLTSIHSDAENKFIGDLIANNSVCNPSLNQAFIGMADFKHNRQWSWTDSTTVNYYNWSPGEPNNGSVTGEYCVEYYCASDGTPVRLKYHWNDCPCEIPAQSFVCKRAATWS